MIKNICKRILEKICLDKRIITDSDNNPYLIRYNLIRIGKGGEKLSLKIHNIIKSDDACLHDHPWYFISIVLRGGYYEWRYKNKISEKDRENLFIPQEQREKIKKFYGPGSILFRKPHDLHRLEVHENGKHTTTLVCTFKKIKPWGFIDNSGKWLDWRKYNKRQHCD